MLRAAKIVIILVGQQRKQQRNSEILHIWRNFIFLSFDFEWNKIFKHMLKIKQNR